MAKTEDWKLCVDFLLRTSLVSRDHKVASSEAEPGDLVQLLRDGILLCELVNRISPMSIEPKDYCHRTQMSQCLCLKNIKVFLHACKNIFNLRDSELFDPSDLYENKDFSRVVNTLSLLSQTSHCQMLEINPFFVNNKPHPSTYYNATSTLNEFHSSHDKTRYNSLTNGNKDEGDVYGRLVDFQPPVTRDPIPDSKRDMCITELVVTEKNFRDVLLMVKDYFMVPLKEILSSHDFDTIFLGIEPLYVVHCGFYDDLKKARDNSRGEGTYASSSLTIPDCFITWKERFLIYGEYCSNLLKAQNLLDELCASNLSVQRQVEESQNAAKEGMFKLRDLLSVPMQRVLKYHLFLKELIKNTEKTHFELKSLERALDEIQDLSLYVNEVKRDNEALLLLEEIEQSIIGYQMPENMYLRDYGRLLMDGELKLKAHSDHKTMNRYVFLFDKVLLLCKPKGECYSFKTALAVSSFNVEDVSFKEKERNFGFTFILGEKNMENAYTIGCKTVELRNKWIEALKLAQDNFSPPHAHNVLHDFEMTSFSEPTICDVCRKLLRGVFFQGYKCQKTQMVVHKGCIEKAKDMSGPPRPPPKPTPLRSVSVNSKGKVKVHCTYDGNPLPPHGRPLIIDVDQVIEVINDDDAYWWEGRRDNKEGYFPKDHVTLLNNVSSRSIASLSAIQKTPPSDNHHLHHHHHRNHSSNNHVHSLEKARHPSFTQDPASPSVGLETHPWYVGGMTRDEASRKLERFQDGTFLVRVSQSDTRRGEYALSIKYGKGHPVKHIKIQKSSDGSFYIADCKMFRSIPELVQYYQQNSLQPSFSEVPTTLQIPYKDAVPVWNDETTGAIGYCVATYDYSAAEAHQLSLRKGDVIAILSQAGDFRGSRGWWKGKLNGKIGYFPSAFVTESENPEILLRPFNP